jgi:hypothetical protein
MLHAAGNTGKHKHIYNGLHEAILDMDGYTQKFQRYICFICTINITFTFYIPAVTFKYSKS